MPTNMINASIRVIALRSVGLCAALLFFVPAQAANWPMWRHDANRSAASPQELADVLHLQWVRDYPALKPAWPDQPRMQFDAAYEPIVLGQTLYFGSSRTDSVTALDTRTGAEKWRFHADGPVRFAPVAWEGRIYFSADDGYLYCVDADKGTLHWKFRGGPSERKVLGNGRLISTWPARGAPVLVDGTVYFAASIWPFMGIFIHALDARTGAVIWTNDGDGAIYMKQPHNADSFAGVAPQGALVAVGDKLLIPGGRSVPACYDRRTGKMIRYQLAENGKRGGADVAAIGNLFFNAGSAHDLTTEKYLGEFSKQPVLTEDVLYGHAREACRAYDLKTATIKLVESIDRKGQKVKTAKWSITELGSCDVPKVETLIKAGSRLYAGAANQVLALQLPLSAPNQEAVVWQAAIEGTPASLVAADERLFVVTREGRLACYGAERVEPRTYSWTPAPLASSDKWTEQARAILDGTKVSEGYCIAWGIGSGGLITELARQSRLHIVAVDPDADKVKAFREQLIAADLYGERIAVHAGDPLRYPFPAYFASLMVSEDPSGAGITLNAEFLRHAFQSLRPFGGVACLPIPTDRRPAFAQEVGKARLVNARMSEASEGVHLVRAGALPGTDNWTHEHADAANTRFSEDQRVKAPLGILWFGGPSNEGILPRHGHGPQPQVIDGRLLIEGIDMLRAMDIYTGRVVWEASLPGLGTFYNNTAHQPGANSSGTNYISTSDGIYVAYGKGCLRLDPATGKTHSEFKLPPLPGANSAPSWGYLNVVGDYLVAGADPLFDPELDRTQRRAVLEKGNNADGNESKKPVAAAALGKVRTKVDNDNLSSSRFLVVMDRHSGSVLWTAAARDGFRHNTICIGGGRLYCIDRLSGAQLGRLKRRGEEPKHAPRLLSLDLQTGKEVWSTQQDVFGTWLSYSSKHDVLVEAGRVARDTLLDEPKGMRAFRAHDGQVLWYEPTYVGPAMIHGDLILKDRSACNLLTGAPRMRDDPLTGIPVEWTWSRNYGCNTPAASEHLLTFRSGAAGYLDYCNDGGTGNFGGFRSSCTNNLIVAGGLLNAPDYTRTCVCSYQNQTSLALVHMPEAEMWTSFGALEPKGPVRRVGINLGAPGDRRAEDGTLWLEYPSVGGQSPALPIRMTPEQPAWFRRHASQIEGTIQPWVGSSGVKGVTSLTVELAKDAEALRAYTVRLFFVEPDRLQPGQRVFDVTIQDREMLKDFDVVRESGGPNRTLVKEFKTIRVRDKLRLEFVPSASAWIPAPVLSGVEVLAEE